MRAAALAGEGGATAPGADRADGADDVASVLRRGQTRGHDARANTDRETDERRGGEMERQGRRKVEKTRERWAQTQRRTEPQRAHTRV